MGGKGTKCIPNVSFPMQTVHCYATIETSPGFVLLKLTWSFQTEKEKKLEYEMFEILGFVH